jgi:hypothetical protein
MKMAKIPKKEWVEQAIVVKKGHPLAHNKEEAVQVAERHSKNGFHVVIENPNSYRVIQRPKRCFMQFRGQKRGEHVTVFWGKLKKGARRSSACR